MKKQANSWIEAAAADLLTIQEIINNELLTQIVAFHSQQAIEKCFKAIIEFNDVPIPKIHNLLTLSEKIKDFVKIDIDYSIIEQLNSLYLDSRYPSELGLLPDGKPTIEIANKFFEHAQSIYNEILKKIQ